VKLTGSGVLIFPVSRISLRQCRQKYRVPILLAQVNLSQFGQYISLLPIYSTPAAIILAAIELPTAAGPATAAALNEATIVTQYCEPFKKVAL